jgi:hypothetical protein
MNVTTEASNNIERLAAEAQAVAYEIGQQCGERGYLPRNQVSFEVELDGMTRRFNILFKSTVDNHGLKKRFMAGYRSI